MVELNFLAFLGVGLVGGVPRGSYKARTSLASLLTRYQKAQSSYLSHLSLADDAASTTAMSLHGNANHHAQNRRLADQNHGGAPTAKVQSVTGLEGARVRELHFPRR